MAQSVRIVLVLNAVAAFSGDDRRRSRMLRLTERLYIHREYKEYIQYLAEQEYNKFFALARSAATKIFALSFHSANNMRRHSEEIKKRWKKKT